MTEQTPATTPDPELPGEGDSDQLPKEDTLEQRGVDDLLAEGYIPPERDPLRGVALTEEETIEGDSIDERAAREVPEVWDQADPPAPDRQPDRAGRIQDVAETVDPDREQDVMADDVGVAGGAATAEEAAMRLTDEDDAAGLTDEGGTPG